MVPSLEFDSAIFSSGKHILELSCPAWAKINAEEPCIWKNLYELDSYFSEHLLLNIPTTMIDMDWLIKGYCNPTFQTLRFFKISLRLNQDYSCLWALLHCAHEEIIPEINNNINIKFTKVYFLWNFLERVLPIIQHLDRKIAQLFILQTKDSLLNFWHGYLNVAWKEGYVWILASLKSNTLVFD